MNTIQKLKKNIEKSIDNLPNTPFMFSYWGRKEGKCEENDEKPRKSNGKRGKREGSEGKRMKNQGKVMENEEKVREVTENQWKTKEK